MAKRLRTLAAVLALGTGMSLTAAPVAQAAYPGRDGRIAFTRGEQIYTIQPNGHRLKKLTSAGKNYRAKWSPDGTRIAYVHETSDGRTDLWVMNANGTHKRRVTRLGSVTEPAWSPDGQWLAFGGTVQLEFGSATVLRKVRANAPFGQPVTLLSTFGPGDTPRPIGVDRFLAWSPDGKRIAFYSHDYPDSPDNYILMYDIASTVSTVWIMTGGECCGYGTFGDVAWGPRGGRLAFDASSEPFVVTATPPKIEMTSYPDFGLTKFTTKPGDQQAAFSPSGKRVAFNSWISGKGKIFIATAHGGKRHVLTNGYQPDWQPLP